MTSNEKIIHSLVSVTPISAANLAHMSPLTRGQVNYWLRKEGSIFQQLRGHGPNNYDSRWVPKGDRKKYE